MFLVDFRGAYLVKFPVFCSFLAAEIGAFLRAFSEFVFKSRFS